MPPSLSRIIAAVPSSGAWSYLLLKRLKSASRVTVVRKFEEELEDVADGVAALAAMSGEPSGPAAIFGEDERQRWASLERLRAGAKLALATPAGLAAAAPEPSEFSAERLALKIGGAYSFASVVAQLAKLGYQRADFVETPGEFAVRGSVIDVFSLEPMQPVRILFEESKIESIRALELETQTSGGFIHELSLAPVGSAQADKAAGASVRDWLDRSGEWLVEAGVEVKLPELPCATVGPSTPGSENFGAVAAPRFQANLDLAAKQIKDWRARGLKVVAFAANRGEDERLRELFEKRLHRGDCDFLIGPLRSGFVHEPDKLAVLTSLELFERSYRSSPRWLRFGAAVRRRWLAGDLKPGDFVVHQQYGIARYQGLRTVDTTDAGQTDCLVLEYRNNDKVYVPMYEFKLVQKFVGAEGHRPRLSSLDTRNWEDVKERVREGVREIAEELLKVQAARAAHPGFAFPADSRIEAEFEQAFPYEETPDQRRAIDEVKADMIAPHPMDRLVVGDVGFGKTEVAMRAALKCVLAGKQAGVLVPTTILADQHFRTFSKRFADYPVRLGLLSRFETRAKQEEVIKAMRAGKVDIVIGTHRLLQKDVRFHDLGLLIVDEEHRFGVKDKERLKALKHDVDVVSLSATPIPRTLYQSLSGLRNVSLIQSAPGGRQPISTFVLPWSEDTAIHAIRQELARGGQVYYVHNRVRTLPERVKELQELLPDVRFAMAHGQMRSDALEKAMWAFFERKQDVLVASSIIESGLDIPTVNTLLVDDAQNFGLAQLYQLRGRIGRERQKAYCYLFYPARAGEIDLLPEEARKRLEALREFGTLGSGMRLAMRDLEIRGAGELLGARQHGFINSVGVEYYSGLIQEEVSRLKGKPVAAKPQAAQLDLGVKAFIPETTLPGELERLEFYKRLMGASKDELPKLRQELEDLSGALPEPAQNLFRLLELRLAATQAGVREIAQRDGRVEVAFRKDAVLGPKTVEVWQKKYGPEIQFVRSEEGDGVRLTLDRPPLEWLDGFFAEL